MSNSLNSPVSHVLKITPQIPVYFEIQDRFPFRKTTQKLEKYFGKKTGFQTVKLQKNITSKNGFYLALSLIVFEI